MMYENQMLSSQIMNDFNQYPILKSMVSSLINNLILIEKMLNILSLLKNNPLVRNYIKSNLNFQVPYPMNYPMMNQNQMMFPNQMMNLNQTINPNQEFDQNQVEEIDYIYINFRTPSEDKKKGPYQLNVD